MKTLGIRNYSNIARRAVERARDKRPQYAQVVRVDGVRVDLQVGQSMNVIKNVEIIGDPAQLAAGQTVQISWWAQDRPVAIAGTLLTDTTQRLETVEERLEAIHFTRPTSTPNPTGGISDWQILRFSQGNLASVHEPNETGMQEALDASASGDMILLPAVELAGDFTIPAGVTVTGLSRFSSIILGTMTLSDKSALEKVRVLDQVTDGAEAVAIVSSGVARIHDSDAWACNCGTGAATGARVNGGALTVTNASISGEAEIGLGYGVDVVSGSAKIYETKVYGSTSLYKSDASAYVHGTLAGDPQCECEVDVTSSLMIGSIYNNWSAAYQPHMPYETGGTLGDISAYTEKASYEANYADESMDQLGGLGATANYLFICLEGSGVIVRKPLDNSAATIMAIDPVQTTEVSYPSMVIVNDNVAYVFYADYQAMLKLAKYDFSTQTRTEIGSWNPTQAWGGNTYDLGRVQFALRSVVTVEDANFDTLVIASSWNESVQNGQSVARFFFVDLLTDTVQEDEQDGFILVGSPTAIPDWFTGEGCPPAAYQDKIVWTVKLDGSNVPTNERTGKSLCLFPTFVIDCTNYSVERVDDLPTPLDATHWKTAYWGAGVDRTTGVYYLLIDNEDTELNPNALVTLDLMAQPYGYQVLRSTNFSGYLAQGDEHPYLIGGPDPDPIFAYSVPELIQIGVFEAQDSGAMSQYGIDEAGGHIWQLNMDLNGGHVQGLPIAGSNAVIREFTFTDGTPWRYTDRRRIMDLFIFNNQAIVTTTCRHVTGNDGWGDTYEYHKEIFVLGA